MRHPLAPLLPALLLPALIAALLLPAPADAQRGKKAPAAEEDSFFGSVDVNVVTVEVFVTDRDGKFVPGLTQNDFEIYEDGKPVEITNFYVAQAETEAPADSPPPAPPAASPGEAPVQTAEAPAPVPAEQRLYLTIFFDNQSLIPPARNRIIHSLKDFVRTQLGPDDNVMIVSYEGAGSMKVRQVAGDRDALVKALDEVAKESTGGLDRQMAFREVLRTLDGTQSMGRGSAQNNMVATAESAAAAIRTFGEERHNEIRNSLKTLGGFVDGLAGLPGRKALLYVSGGNSMRPAETLYESWMNRFAAVGRQTGIVTSLSGFQNDLTTRFREIGERANANRVTFYSLGATTVPAADSAEASGDSAWTRDQQIRETQNLTQSLLLVAAPTGGLASIDPTAPAVFLEQMRHDFEHFYSLGYAPADRKTPGNHKIEVRVKRAGLKVRHREGYRDRTTRDRLNHQAMAALLFGAGGDNPLAVDVLIEGERPARKNRRQREVSLLVTFPMSKLVLLPQEKVHEGRVTLLLGARDGEGRSSDLTQIDIPVRVPQAQLAAAQGQSVAYRATLTLRPGPHTVVVGVRDEYGNVNSTLTFLYGEAKTRAKAGR